MEIEIPDKTYFRIGEVSRILGVEPYVVRYWETEFRTVKPLRTSSDQRLYRRKDLEELATIKQLLYAERFTIPGARKRLQELRKEPAVPKAPEATDGEGRERLRSIKSELEAIRKILTRK